MHSAPKGHKDTYLIVPRGPGPSCRRGATCLGAHPQRAIDLAGLQGVDDDVAEAARGELRAELVRRPAQDRDGAVVDREHLAHAEELDRQCRLARPHRVVPADRQERDVRVIQLADEPLSPKTFVSPA